MTPTDIPSGRDGSRQVTVGVNADGTGANFVNGQITANGEAVSHLRQNIT
jgi:hypothetical protein